MSVICESAPGLSLSVTGHLVSHKMRIFALGVLRTPPESQDGTRVPCLVPCVPSDTTIILESAIFENALESRHANPNLTVDASNVPVYGTGHLCPSSFGSVPFKSTPGLRLGFPLSRCPSCLCDSLYSFTGDFNHICFDQADGSSWFHL